VVADIEVAGSARRRWGRTVAADDELDAQHFVGVAHDAFGEGKVEVDPYNGEDKTKG